jgi:hypothetical protein
VFQVKREEIKTAMAKATLTLPHLQQCEWRVDHIISSSAAAEAMHGSVHFKLKLDKDINGSNQKTVAFEVGADKFAVLYGELREARKMMDAL